MYANYSILATDGLGAGLRVRGTTAILQHLLRQRSRRWNWPGAGGSIDPVGSLVEGAVLAHRCPDAAESRPELTAATARLAGRWTTRLGSAEVQGHDSRVPGDELGRSRVRVHQGNRLLQGWTGERSASAEQSKQQWIDVAQLWRSVERPNGGCTTKGRGSTVFRSEAQWIAVGSAEVWQSAAGVDTLAEARVVARHRGVVLQATTRRCTARDDHWKYLQERTTQDVTNCLLYFVCA